MLAPVSKKVDGKSYDPARDQFYVDLKLTVAHAFAQALGISDQELQSQWEQGKSIAAVAQARGLNTDQVKQSALSLLKSYLDHAVQANKLQQEEADKIYKDMEPAMDGLMNGK